MQFGKNLVTRTLLLLFASLLFSTKLSSTDMTRLSLKELAEKSNDIIVTRIDKINSYRDLTDGRIYTDIEFIVDDCLKGQLKKGESKKMILYGGTVNGITVFGIGMPGFAENEETVLFLRQSSSERFPVNYRVVGLAQGKFNITTDSRTSEKQVVREQINLPLQLEKDGLELALTTKTAIKLSDFINHIENYTN